MATYSNFDTDGTGGMSNKMLAHCKLDIRHKWTEGIDVAVSGCIDAPTMIPCGASVGFVVAELREVCATGLRHARPGWVQS